MVLLCVVVVFGCTPKKQVQSAEPKALAESWVIVKFEVEDEESVAERYALVNPWELEEGEAWKCKAPTGGSGRHFMAVLQRDKMSSSGFLVGLLEANGEHLVVLYAGAFPIGESDAATLTLGGEQSRTVMVEVISGERAQKIKQEVPDLRECEKKANALVPERVK